MTAGIAHDLGNIIQILSSTVELLDQHPTIKTTMSLQPPMRRAASSVARATALIAQIIRFARGGAAENESVDLKQCLMDLKPLLLWIGNNRTRIDIQVDADTPPLVCNRSHLENAILNLALNARDAMPKGGVLSITVSPRRERNSDVLGLVLCVSDDGDGMARETMARALDPFFTTKTGARGAGLGLAMVRRFAEENGGTVSLESSLGLGTTVTLWLPLEPRQRT
jgi:signal transduction histidine kinase